MALDGHLLPDEWPQEYVGCLASNLVGCQGNGGFGDASRRHSFDRARDSATIGWTSRRKKTPDMEIPSSLIIYPMPYPSLTTEPNPNNLSAGLLQFFEVDKIDIDSNAQPGSVKILDIVCYWRPGADHLGRG
jgi:hypothetical protein